MSEHDVKAASARRRVTPEVEKVLRRVSFKRLAPRDPTLKRYEVRDGDEVLGQIDGRRVTTYRKYKGDRLRYPSGQTIEWSYYVAGKGRRTFSHRASAAAALIEERQEGRG